MLNLNLYLKKKVKHFGYFGGEWVGGWVCGWAGISLFSIAAENGLSAHRWW